MATHGESSGLVSQAEFERLMSAMKEIEDQMKSMKRELCDEREAADERLVKKMRLDKGVTFKKKGNEKQHQFNEKVKDKMEAATRCLSSTPPAIEKAKEALQEGEQLITARQKLIRIADRSEFGWTTVSEYEEDELADGLDDEKRLYKAELRAGRKVKVMKAKFNKKKKDYEKPQHWKPKWQPNLNQLAVGTSSALVPNVPQQPVTGTKPRPLVSLGPCFKCGSYGHLSRSCPELLFQLSNQGK